MDTGKTFSLTQFGSWIERTRGRQASQAGELEEMLVNTLRLTGEDGWNQHSGRVNRVSVCFH